MIKKKEVSIIIYDENSRKRIINFLQWNDRNGCYADENCDIEGVERMTYEDAVKYFFFIIKNKLNVRELKSNV
ncbi:hypothetical protein [Clostridium sp. 3-3]|uniref:hypothetical protein n=1 Tax=Clostridium sp. 3-3 TaxID=2070757 RepID=UPI000CDB20BA|nr:hypothetical protein [Clostridium sp. 3-3]POO86837.1 hypothetical protein C1H59_08730 [Clostridium sp. 3-3]